MYWCELCKDWHAASGNLFDAAMQHYVDMKKSLVGDFSLGFSEINEKLNLLMMQTDGKVH
jgi:hypothetical protein